MFTSISHFIHRRRWLVLLLGLLFLIGSGVYGGDVSKKLTSGGFNDPKSESIQAQNTVAREFPHNKSSLIVLIDDPAHRRDATDPAFANSAKTALARLSTDRDVLHITDYYDTGAKALLSNDHKSTYAVVSLNEDKTDSELLNEVRPLLHSDELRFRLGGTVAINQEVTDQIGKDLTMAETISFTLLAILLIFVFASLVAASLPLAMGALSIVGGLMLTKIATQFTDVSIYAMNVITLLGLGLAIDYSLFIVSRFREELRSGANTKEALATTMNTAGRTVLFSGFTVGISLLTLLVFPVSFLKGMAIGGTAAIVVAMLAAITVLPALLAVLGPRVNSLHVPTLFRRLFWRTPRQRREADAHEGFWYRLSRFVMDFPVPVLGVVVIILLLLGAPFLKAKFATPDYRTLPEGRESRVVSEALNRDFARNSTDPIQVVIRTEGDPTSQKNIILLYDYVQELRSVHGVTGVESLVSTKPGFNSTEYRALYSAGGLAASPQAAGAVAQYVHGSYTIINLSYQSPPLSTDSQHIVSAVRAVPPPQGLSVQTGGTSAQLLDLLDSLAKKIPLAIGLIMVAIFVILFLLLGSIVIPLESIVINVLSLSASFGALVWIFQDGHLSKWLHFTPLTDGIDATQPILIFAIAFGLSMDYAVFLLSRIKEQHLITGDNREAVSLGIQKTGRVITSAALLLIIVVAAFATSKIVIMKQIGIGLALAILIDATVVRMLLVPAIMRLVGEWNWYAPSLLTRIYERVGLSEVEAAPKVEIKTYTKRKSTRKPKKKR